MALCFSVVLFHRIFGEDCDTIAPVLSAIPEKGNYVGGNFSLLCSYNTDNINASYIIYQFIIAKSGAKYGYYDTVYEFDFVGDSGTGPLPNYENETVGSIVDTGVSLTIFSAHWRYTSTSWRCSIITPQCSFGETSADVAISLKGKYVPHTTNSIYVLLLCLLLFISIFRDEFWTFSTLKYRIKITIMCIRIIYHLKVGVTCYYLLGKGGYVFGSVGLSVCLFQA